MKGGTPAMHKKVIVSVDVKKKFNFKSEKEYKVLKLVFTNCIKVQKIANREIL